MTDHIQKKRALNPIAENIEEEGSSSIVPVVYSAYQLLLEGKCELIGTAGEHQANYSDLIRDLYQKHSILEHNFKLLINKLNAK